MEPFPYFHETMTPPPPPPPLEEEEILYWDFTAPPKDPLDLVFSVFDPSPPEGEGEMPLPPFTHPTAAVFNPPPPPFTSVEEMICWAFSPPLGESPDLVPVVFDPPLPLPVIPRSAFVRYQRPYYWGGNESAGSGSGGAGGKKNIHKRVVEFLKRIPAEEEEKRPVPPSEGRRCFRHMMRERQRREKLSQSYSDLHSMIVPRPKADKNSIVQSTAAYLRELKGVESSLRRRREELRASIARGDGGKSSEVTKIRLQVGNPSSPIDSMIGALRRLQGMDLKARSIRSSFNGGGLFAVVDVGTKMATAEEVERAVQEALLEVEWKFRRSPSLPGSSNAAVAS